MTKRLDLLAAFAYNSTLPVGSVGMLSLILGLGNIGEEYEKSRHNVGFEVLDIVRRRLKAEFQPGTSKYDWAVRQQGERRLVLAWPRTLMNLSGLAAKDLLQENRLEPSEMLVVVDDFNLPLGNLRFREYGSDGGHNGLLSLIQSLGTEKFPRLRLGIGPVPDNRDTIDFVLERFENTEREQAKNMITTAAEAVLFAIEHRLEKAMTKYNVNPAWPEQ